ncbi:hypothetical protein ACJX0J_018129, partial [Zea mays]
MHLDRAREPTHGYQICCYQEIESTTYYFSYIIPKTAYSHHPTTLYFLQLWLCTLM